MDEKQQKIDEFYLRKEQVQPVTKDNSLIQSIAQRRFELSVMEQKAICYILSKLNPLEENPDEERIVSFEINHFCKVCGIKYESGGNYQNVKNALDKLATNGFWINTPEKTKLFFQWIATPEIYPGSGVISVTIPSKIMPYLCKMSGNFTTFQLFNVLTLKSAYSIMLYELFKSWAYQGTFTVDLSALREYLGIKDDKYTEFKAFRRGVLERSIKEIESYTDIRVTFRAIRSGRSFSKIEFTVSELKGVAEAEAMRRALAEINGVKYKPGQMHLFED